MKKLEPPPGYKLIFRPYFRCSKTGKIIWAKNYGIRAFPIVVKR